MAIKADKSSTSTPLILDMGAKPESKTPSFSRLGKFLGVLFLLLIFLALLWTQRFNLVKRVINQQLESINIEADYNFLELSQTAMTLENVKARYEGQIFFSTETAHIEFDIQELRDGHIRVLKLVKPTLAIHVDEKGQITDGWMPASSKDSSAKKDLPIDHIEIVQGTGDITTPYGNIDARVEGDFKAKDDFAFKLNLASDRLRENIYQASLLGEFSLTRRGEVNHLSGHAELPDWSSGEFSGYNLQLDGEADIWVGESGIEASSDFKIHSQAYDGDILGLDRAEISWKGESLWPETGGVQAMTFVGAWGADIKNARMTDSRQRNDLARQLSLYDATRKSPVLQDFVPVYIAMVNKYLSGSDIAASGHVNKTDGQFELFLDKNFSVTHGAQQFLLKPRPNRPTLVHRRPEAFSDAVSGELKGGDLNKEGLYEIWGDVSISQPLPMTFKNTYMLMGKDKTGGLDITNIKGRLITPRPWTAETLDGQQARLGAMAVDFTYDKDHPGADGMVMALDGRLDFDGTLPAGYGKGVSAEGRIKIDLYEQMEIHFAQRPGTHIQIAEYINSSDWEARNVAFDMLSPYAFFRQQEGADAFEIEMGQVSGELYSRASGSSMRVDFERVHSKASLDGLVQSWIIEGSSGQMHSDTLPAKNTSAQLDHMQMLVELGPGGALNYSLQSGDVQAQTDLVAAKNIQIKGEGTADSISIDYDNALVKFKTIYLPIFPLSGRIVFNGPNWHGQATSYFPGAEETPIEIKYIYQDGHARADMLVENLQFNRRGLQPQDLVPSLKGKIADVNGAVIIKAEAEYGSDQPLKSSGFARLIDIDFGTAVGPLEGVNADLQFSSFLPVTTDGKQTLRIARFDPGIILENGEVEFSVVPDGISLYKAGWPLGAGHISLDPGKWSYSAKQNLMTLRVNNVSLSDFFGEMGSGSLEVTGDVSGEIPVVIEGLDVSFDNGRIAVDNGGVIRFSSPQTDQLAQNNQVTDMTFKALKDFYYEQLEIRLNGPLIGGLIDVGLNFIGSNPKVLGGAKFDYRININADLMKLIDSLRIENAIRSQIKNQLTLENDPKAQQQLSEPPELNIGVEPFLPLIGSQ